MLDRESMNKLKKSNISKDAEKTKERVRAVWKSLKKDVRNEILEYSDLKQVTVERAYTNGGISAKLVAAFSQILRIDPLFLTGQSDEQRQYREPMIIKFLTDLGYTKLNSIADPDKKKPPKKQTKEKALDTPVNEKENLIETTVPSAEGDKPDVEPYVPDTIEPAALPKDDNHKDKDQDKIGKGTDTLTFIDTPAGWSALSSAILENIGDSKKKKINDLEEEDFILLLQSKYIQAGFDTDKDNILMLIKHMLVS
jgi:hypothetical protein